MSWSDSILCGLVEHPAKPWSVILSIAPTFLGIMPLFGHPLCAMAEVRATMLTGALSIWSNRIAVIGCLKNLSWPVCFLLPRVSEVMAARAATTASGRFSSCFCFSAASKTPTQMSA